MIFIKDGVSHARGQDVIITLFAEFWVHCNDSNLELCSIEDVMASQAYILFYSLRGIDPQPHIFSPPLTPTVPSPSSLSPIASDDEVEKW